MILFLIITCVFSLIGTCCLRKKFSYGIFPIIITSSIIAGVICTVVNVTLWKIEGPDTEITTAEKYVFDDYKDFLNNNYSIADVGDVKRVVINDTITKPFLTYKRTSLRKDVGLFWKVGYGVDKDFVLHVNKKDNGLFRAAKDSAN